MHLSNKVYDTLKWITLHLLPALGTLYFALSSIWGFNYGEQVIGTITAITTFLGVILGISSANYDGDGTFFINGTNEDGMPIQLNEEVDDLHGQKFMTLKIKE
jgi:hypothetical protein